MDEKRRAVICNLEGSRSDANAVELARRLAVAARARVALVAVAPVVRGEHPAWTLAEARTALELTAGTLGSTVAVDCYLELGNPVRRLLELARDERALFLVVGTSGDGSDRPPSLTARGLTRSAPCPVVIVPETATLPALVPDG